MAPSNIANQTAIRIWAFRDAPNEFQGMSQNGGDEDWLAYIPKNYRDAYIPWMEDGSSFGCSSMDEYEIGNGDVVRIGSHA